MFELYETTDPLVSALWIAGGFAALCWVLSLVTKEYSWVDRLWSITPPLFAIHFAGAASFDDARLNLMAALTVVWGVRLTYNFARKGGYKPGGEDYRWEEVQEKIGPGWFQVLNATFLAMLIARGLDSAFGVAACRCRRCSSASMATSSRATASR